MGAPADERLDRGGAIRAGVAVGSVRRARGRSDATTEVAALALVANRVTVAVRRAIEGVSLSASDVKHLRAARAQLLNDFESAGGVRTATRHLRSRGLIVTAAKAASHTRDSTALRSAVRGYADDLDRLARRQEASNARGLLKYYEELAEAARRYSRQRVETITRSR